MLLAGLTRCHADQWQRLVRNKETLRRVCEGVRLEVASPSTIAPPAPRPASQITVQALQECLQQGIVVPAPQHHRAVATFYAREKSDGGLRPILDCRAVNECLPQPPHIKLPTIKQLRGVLTRSHWMMKIDVRSAFHLIPLHPDYRKYTTFEMNGSSYQYTCLSMGLSLAPAAFQHTLACALAAAREHGAVPHAVRLYQYLDDVLIVGDSLAELHHTASALPAFLQNLGLPVSPKKSVLVPTKTITFPGVVIDLTAMEFKLEAKRWRQLKHDVRQLLSATPNNVTIYKLAGTLGKCNWAAQVLPDAMAALRPLLRARTAALRITNNNFAARLPWASWTPEQRAALQWWSCENQKRVLPIDITEPELTLITDASPWAGAAHLLDNDNQEIAAMVVRFTDAEASASQNTRETLVPLLTMSHLPIPPHSHVRVVTDSTTHAAYLRRSGGPVTHLSHIVESLYHWMEAHDIRISVQHMLGTEISQTDWLSRQGAIDKTDIRISTPFIRQLCALWKLRLPAVDLFSSRANTVAPLYFTWPFQEPGAAAADALQQGWGALPGPIWCFPPHKLLERTLTKLENENVNVPVVVIAPDLHSGNSSLTLRQRAVRRVAIPPNAIQSGPTAVPLSAHWTRRLAAWLLC